MHLISKFQIEEIMLGRLVCFQVATSSPITKLLNAGHRLEYFLDLEQKAQEYEAFFNDYSNLKCMLEDMETDTI